MSNEICDWYGCVGEMEGHYFTGCGGAFTLMDGDVEANEFIYCPFCGLKIEAHEQHISDIPDDESTDDE